jgi:hypothetical protein
VLSEKWLINRIELFKKFAIPSVANQINTNFTWIIILNEKTPYRFKQEITELCKDHVILYSVHNKWKIVFNDFLKTLENKEYQIQTRFDSDDAIHKDFINDIQKQFNSKKIVIDIPIGYVHYLNNVFYSNLKLNQFVTLIKRTNDPTTIYSSDHNKVDQLASIVNINKRLWLASIHSMNAAMVINAYTDLNFKRDIKEIYRQIKEINQHQISKDFGIEI